MKLSVIIPAYNEEAVIEKTVSEVQARSASEISEIIVADGGSSDQTVAKAESAGAKVVVSPRKGRAAQMNYGTKLAGGEILYFLHADSIPPPNFDRQVIKGVADGFSAGCFRLAFGSKHWLLRIYAWFTRFDINAFRFGDQSLFIKQNVFCDIDGFKEDHLVMEDNEIIRRIKKDYSFVILDDVVTTSARAYQKAGVLKLQLVFVLIYVLYFLGVEQEKLVAIKKKVVGDE